MKKKLYTLDADKILSAFGDDTVLRYDAAKLMVAVQGLRNRDFPEIYWFWQEADHFWLDYMMEEGNFCMVWSCARLKVLTHLSNNMLPLSVSVVWCCGMLLFLQQ